ncbi:hypothetical protein DMB38_14540 [Streptomyces sp. WAC 06738]|uniref:hypothetical protein n=1 Tax=Streptomyces sp. WAC 06738 TaxID=2203210 RepID=UPI000F6E8ABE|nr:hypothetical protein [Streptomyces sp. WAC 06738]AZM46863.1 hypothetical protein DMB38_14540 [Streptomyces sp. WAC 06738]
MEGWDRVGRWSGYGAALALAPYALIKVSWVAGALLGVAPVGGGFSLTGWLLLNTVTIGMAAIGIALGLALVRPWGMRIPGWMVAFCAWAGSGFLVSILPYAVFSTLWDGGGGGGGGGGGDGGSASRDDPAMPGWEAALIQFSFVSMGLGLALALPAYLRRRWPEAFTGRAGDGPRTVACRSAGVAAAVGLVWLYWAAGGTAGVAHPGERSTDGYLLTGLSAFWALAGAAAVRSLAQTRPAPVPRPLLLGLGWLGSGSLFAWSGWKLPLTVYVALARPADVTLPESPAVAAALHLAAVMAGLGMLGMLVSPARRCTSSSRRTRRSRGAGTGRCWSGWSRR